MLSPTSVAETVPSPAAWRPIHSLAAVGIVLLAMLWLSVNWVAGARREQALQAEFKQNANVARVLQEQTERVIATVDQATRRVTDAVAANPTESPDLGRFANETGLAPRILVQLSHVWADGRFAASNLDPTGAKTGHVDLSEREHIRIHLSPQMQAERDRLLPANGLFIGKPVLGKVSGRWTIQLTRRIVGRQGQTLGVVVASLDPAYFEEVYASVQLGRSGGVALVGLDRGVRARVIGGQSAGMGKVLGESSIAARSDLGAEGRIASRSSVDGIERLYAWRTISGYPLNIFVFTGSDEALNEWRISRNVMFGLAAALSALVIAVLALTAMGIRRQERNNAALRASEMQAQAANRAKTEFLAAISHELRTPLTSIRGFAELMERRIDNPVFQDQASMIRKGAEHLNTLLTEILDLTKVEAGAMPIVREPQDLRRLVSDVGEFFEVAAAAKGLALAVRVADDVPASVVCDGLRTKQILNNLLSNAVKFTEQGGIGIEVALDGAELKIDVIDSGPGIPPEQQSIIFERFRQGSDRVSYQHGGTGLGLALSRALAELMGGRLSVSSVPGQGARFTLALPLA